MESSTSYATAGKFPAAGFYMSLFAGILMIIQGLWQIFFGSIYWAIIISLGVGLSVLFIGILLIINGIIINSAAYSLRTNPGQHALAGATVVIFSLLGLLVGGGFLIGSVIGIIGGFLAIIGR